MNKEEIDGLEKYLKNDLPKINVPITTFGSVDLEDVMDSIKKFKKIPTIDELLTENRNLKHQLEEKNKVIDKLTRIIELISLGTYETETEDLCDEAYEILERGKNE